MKKILLLLLICSFILPLVACGGPKETTTYPITSVSKNGNSYTFEYIDGEKTKTMTITPNGENKRVERGGANAYTYYPDGRKHILFLTKETMDLLNGLEPDNSTDTSNDVIISGSETTP
jgi:hypothetical protein